MNGTHKINKHGDSYPVDSNGDALPFDLDELAQRRAHGEVEGSISDRYLKTIDAIQFGEKSAWDEAQRQRENANKWRGYVPPDIHQDALDQWERDEKKLREMESYAENLRGQALFVVGVLEQAGFPKVAEKLAAAAVAPESRHEIGTTDPRTAGAGLDPDNASHSIRKSEGAGDVSASTNTWRHKKRGTLYTEVACAWLQTETPIGDGATMTIYRDDDGRWWVRPRSEFMDGRFEAVPAAATCSENAVGRVQPGLAEALAIIREVEGDNGANFAASPCEIEWLAAALQRMARDGCQMTTEVFADLAAGEESDVTARFGSFDGYADLGATLNAIFLRGSVDVAEREQCPTCDLSMPRDFLAHHVCKGPSPQAVLSQVRVSEGPTRCPGSWRVKEGGEVFCAQPKGHEGPCAPSLPTLTDSEAIKAFKDRFPPPPNPQAPTMKEPKR